MELRIIFSDVAFFVDVTAKLLIRQFWKDNSVFLVQISDW